MNPLDGFRPPPGAPGAVRDGAACWRRAAEALQPVADRTQGQWRSAAGSWRGPARAAFEGAAEPFLTALGSAAGALRQAAGGLDVLADGIEAAQSEYRQRMLAVGFTAAAGVLLTPLTFGGSDEGAALAVTAELAAVTELAAGAAETVLVVLAGVAEQAVALAARWAVLSGAALAADVGAAAVVHGPGEALQFVHLGDDFELALVGAVAVPVAAELAAAAGGAAGVLGASGVAGLTARLALGGASLASADALVRAALRQGLDPGELAMMALPLGGGLGRAGAARTVPLGFADEAAFASFARDLTGGLREAGYGDVVPVFQGSSVTGVKYTTGAPFDVGRRSDFDIALASPTLFATAKVAGIEVRSRPSRTAPLKPKDLRRVGLFDLAERLSAGVERDVHFMIYPDLSSAVERAGGIRLP
jgi:hypothetical protein